MVGWVLRANTPEALAGESGVAKRQGLRVKLFGGCPLQREEPKPVGLMALRAARAKPLRSQLLRARQDFSHRSLFPGLKRAITIGDQTVTEMQAGTSGTTAASLSVVSGSGQTAVYGSVFTSPLTVLVARASGNPVTGATVLFTGTGVSLSKSTAVTSANGQASVMATATLAGASNVIARISGVNTTVTFSLTATPANLIVKANDASRSSERRTQPFPTPSLVS
jgi:hypothetical protein